MRVFTLIGASSVLVWSILAAAGCSSDCEDKNACGSGTAATGGMGGSSGDGGTDATGGAGGTSGDAGCDSNASPSQESCLVSDEHAVFVSPAGNDGAIGGQGDPLKSITEATNVANAEGKIVVVCNGTYDEHVKITTGAKVYGGFDCSTWAHQSGTRADVVPTTTGYALEIDSVTDAVVIEDIGFKVADGVAPGESSIAGFVKNSSNVLVRRVAMEAGAGVEGSEGALTEFTLPSAAALEGNDATGDQGGPVKTPCTCPGGKASVGGKGGDGGVGATGGGPGQPALGGGAAGTAGDPCTSGGTGAAGPGDKHGGGAQNLGTITAAGWEGTPGAPGEPGEPGQGGGGGGGSTQGGGGGSGACGGCGGAGASGGGAGGSSIAVLVLDSVIVIESSVIKAANGGQGGKGIAGQPGQSPGGAKGSGASFGCEGGNEVPPVPWTA